ncbi:phage shock protein operon transcriptional activator [Sulfidibacter corallicola]|uniref:phage shock protein operon transcriptional activator n=1 Tax=Sulfidibacter corallicola TaxID=2818388 RepID=UPI003B20CC58
MEKYRMLGESESFLDSMQRVSRAAKVNRPVLIIGERGTGKELVAARLHYLSPRWQQPRITINCAAFSKDLLESEVFGYEQGAFTGATKTKPGRFELAHQGSLFLDELANSPLALQEKLLRVLEYGEFERVGGIQSLQVDVRVIAATNQDLPELCRRQKFKEDLLDRLSFEVITLPPLRERIDDIPLLVSNFAVRMAREMNLRSAPRFSRPAILSMMEYPWPGNVRELKNTVERAVYRSDGEPIEEIEFDPFDSPFRPASTPPADPGVPRVDSVPAPVRPIESGPSVAAVAGSEAPEVDGAGVPSDEARSDEAVAVGEGDPSEAEEVTLPAAIEALERKMVTQALEKTLFNQTRAAEALGVSYYQLRRILKRLDLP